MTGPDVPVAVPLLILWVPVLAAAALAVWWTLTVAAPPDDPAEEEGGPPWEVGPSHPDWRGAPEGFDWTREATHRVCYCGRRIALVATTCGRWRCRDAHARDNHNGCPACLATGIERGALPHTCEKRPRL